MSDIADGTEGTIEPETGIHPDDDSVGDPDGSEDLLVAGARIASRHAGLWRIWAKLRALPRDHVREDLIDRGFGILLYMQAGEITPADAGLMLRKLLTRNSPQE
ncbi:hypothetical protein AB0C07_14310 [Actinoplanes missouriensis]|uniref:hypothetical protein n=1 Tax=Actinoplanes missouriensis TaxID=1866 RepID=UPI0033EEFEE0